MGIVQKAVDVLQMATEDDIIYIMRSAFDAHISEREIRELVAILLGSEYLLIGSPYGHLYLNSKKATFLELRRGYKQQETEIRFELAELIERNADFNYALSATKNAC